MRASLIAAFIILAGCAHQLSSQTTGPDTGYDNKTKWQMQNEEIQKACVLRIIEIAPPTATREELDYNLRLCLLRNGAFI